MNVYLTETRLPGRRWLYQVIVDGEVYDQFASSAALSVADQAEVAAGYRDALTGLAAA